MAQPVAPDRRGPPRCACGLQRGVGVRGQCLSMADYVAVTGTRGGATAPGGPFMLPSLPMSSGRTSRCR
jgi:hypothetical protein